MTRSEKRESMSMMSRRWIALVVVSSCLVPSCIEDKVRMYVSVSEGCTEYCDGLTFLVDYDSKIKKTLVAGEQVLIRRSIGDNGKLFVTVHNESGADNHPLRCQKYISSQIDIQGWGLMAEDQVYVYYNQLIYFQNQDIHVDITCAPLPEIVPGSCDGVSCWQPSENVCTENFTIELLQPRGVCAAGECSYPSTEVLCSRGWCIGGKCLANDLCENVYCISPPPNSCTQGGKLTTYVPNGVCEEGECRYEQMDLTCPADTCSDGICSKLPCHNVYCDKPPANYCVDDQTLKSFSPDGRCAAVNGRPTCIYAEKESRCEYGCSGGSCIVYPCQDVVCNKPPANYCDYNDLIVFDDVGFCNNGACRYFSHRIFCAERCLEGKCRGKDACLGQVCNDPPAPFCVDDERLRVYADEGDCADGICSYNYQYITCSGACRDGRCAGNPCAGVSCNHPPSDYCVDETTAMQFSEVGTCEDGECDYGGDVTFCPEGCLEGLCPE